MKAKFCIAIALSHCLVSVVALSDEPKTKSLLDAVSRLQVTIPDFGSEPEFSESVISEGITKQFRFVFKNGSAVVLISTKIRPDLPKDDRVLDRVEPRYRMVQETLGKDGVSIQFLGKSPQRVFEVVVNNAAYDETFPLLLARDATANAVKSVAVSQIYVESGRLIECALYLPNKSEQSLGDLAERARKACADWRAGVKILPDRQ